MQVIAQRYGPNPGLFTTGRDIIAEAIKGTDLDSSGAAFSVMGTVEGQECRVDIKAYHSGLYGNSLNGLGFSISEYHTHSDRRMAWRRAVKVKDEGQGLRTIDLNKVYACIVEGLRQSIRAEDAWTAWVDYKDQKAAKAKDLSARLEAIGKEPLWLQVHESDNSIKFRELTDDQMERVYRFALEVYGDDEAQS
jgi:hypothetical protein